MNTRIGFGSLTDSNLQTAATVMLQSLQDNGCPQGFDSDVQAFQQAYVNAGGHLPNDSGGRSGVDGLYGNNTRAALQATISANSGNAALAGQTAPQSCIASAGGGGGGGSSSNSASNSSTSSTTTTSTASMLPTWGWAALGVALLGGAYMVYESTQHPVATAHRGMHGHARKLLGHKSRSRRGHSRRRR